MLLVPTACGGSSISPKEALKANQRVLGQGGNGSTVVNPNTGTSVDPNSGQPVTGGTSTGGTSTGGTSTGGTSTGGTSNTPAGSGIKAGSCAGFKNSTGITDKVIKIGNSSDISGPVPGLFTAAQQATKAYVQYFNATQTICGRKLELTNLDSKTDAGADQQSYQKMCESVFASVGSMSAFDSGGAQTAQKCGLPDMRTAAVTAARNACSTCFGAQATGPHEFSNAVPDFIVKNYHAASQKAAFLYLNAGAAAENGKYQQKVEEQRGMKFLYSSGIAVEDFNY